MVGVRPCLILGLAGKVFGSGASNVMRQRPVTGACSSFVVLCVCPIPSGKPEGHDVLPALQPSVCRTSSLQVPASCAAGSAWLPRVPRMQRLRIGPASIQIGVVRLWGVHRQQQLHVLCRSSIVCIWPFSPDWCSAHCRLVRRGLITMRSACRWLCIMSVPVPDEVAGVQECCSTRDIPSQCADRLCCSLPLLPCTVAGGD
jgi:hypothetical protein